MPYTKIADSVVLAPKEAYTYDINVHRRLRTIAMIINMYLIYKVALFQFLAGRVSVILSRVTLFSAGLYSCEVSADFPDYDTEIRRQHMHVFGE